MKRFSKWIYFVLVMLLTVGLIVMVLKNREQSADLKQLQTALQAYERKESDYEERLDNLRKERQEVIDSMVSAYKDNVDLKAEKKRLSSTVEELYLRNISNLQLLFGEKFEVKANPDLDARMQDWLQQYMDTVILDDAEGHAQLFASPDTREDDPIWKQRGDLIGFLQADIAAEQHAEQVGEAIRLFALTEEYEVIAATFMMQQSGGQQRIVQIEE